MMGQRRVYYYKRLPREYLIALLLLVALVIMACEGMPPNQPPSPLHPDTDLRLVTNGWQVIEVTYQGEEVQFDAVRPFYVQWGWNGFLRFNALDCNGGSFHILSEGEHRYRLRGGVTSAADCGELRNGQFSAVLRALRETYEYSFQDSRLWLTGEEARVVLEAVEAFPAFPTAEPSLILNRWRWVAVTAQGEAVALDALPPLFSVFSAPGWLSVRAGECLEGYYRILAQGQDTYALTQESLRSEGCDVRGEAQAEQALAALEATTQYALRSKWLFLTGEDGWIVLEIDNPPANE